MYLFRKHRLVPSKYAPHFHRISYLMPGAYERKYSIQSKCGKIWTSTNKQGRSKTLLASE